MINKAQQDKERRKKIGPYFPYFTFAAAMAFFCSLWPFKKGRIEPFTLNAPQQQSGGQDNKGRFEKYTFKRIKKIRNFFAYSWIDRNGKGIKPKP